MNLEEVEQQSLKYLAQVRDPMVPVETLLRYLQRNDEFVALTENELLDFLRDHELFRVVDPLPLGDPMAAQQLAGAGFVPKPRVMLATRVPTAAQLQEGMLEEMDRMTEALVTALYEARDADDKPRVKQIQTILRRAKELRAKIDGLM